MEYQVPQFIEIEDKVVGPLTLKQFIYIAGAAGLCVVFFVHLPTIYAFMLAIPTAAFAAALSFYKVNGKTFLEMIEAGFNYYTRAKLFLWKHQDPKIKEIASSREVSDALKTHHAQKLTRGALSDLAWSLDIQNPVSEKTKNI